MNDFVPHYCCSVPKLCPTLCGHMDCSVRLPWSLLKFIPIESVMLSIHLIVYCPLLLLPSVFPSIRVFSNESILHIFSDIKTNNVLLDKEREGGDFTMNHNDDNDQPIQHIKKQTYFPMKVRLVKAMVFPVVIYGCERWTGKKAERWRIDAFELWCWRRCLRIPWTARRSNQSILKEISPKYSLEGLMLKLKLFWCWSWPPDVKNWLIGKDLDAGKN